MKHKPNLDIQKEMQALAQRKNHLLKLLKLRGEVSGLERAVMRGTNAKVVLNIIAEEVCENFKLSMASMMSQCREESVVLPRQIVFYLGRQLRNIPYQQIGRTFQRHHGTVMHACASIQARLDTDQHFTETMSSMVAACKTRLEEAKVE